MTEKKVERIVVKRHHLGYRVLHWCIAISILFLSLTGLQIGGIYGNLPLISNARAYHIIVGIAWGCTFFAFFYLVATGDYKWLSLRRIPYAIRFFVKEAKAWLGIGHHVEEPILYDAEKKKYVEKVIPTGIIVWWTYLILTIFTGITGLAMAFSDSIFSWLFQLCTSTLSTCSSFFAQ